MGIPPHAARLAGAWAVKSAAAQQSVLESRAGVGPASGVQSRPQHRHLGPNATARTGIAVSRILHPLHRHA